MSDPKSGTNPPAGPLDELFPGLREPNPSRRDSASAIHPFALRLEDPEEPSLVLTVWSDPGGPAALHHALRPMVEGSLLTELTHTPSVARERSSRFRSLKLVIFPSLPFDAEPALRAFGFVHADGSRPGFRRALGYLRHEASALGTVVADEPSLVFEAEIAKVPSEIEGIERALLEGSDDEAWGAKPGAPFRRLVRAALPEDRRHGAPITLLGELERRLVSGTSNVIRLLPPTVFQALCDGIAVAASVDVGATLDWGLCEPDEEGMAPPPVVRVRSSQGTRHVPLGTALLRWCVMPILPGESIPPLVDWIKDEFRD